MAWANTLLDASFKGITFEVVKTNDSSERVTVEHSYPYVDGADIEDMGRGARHFSVDAIFYGDDYEIRLQEFLAILDQSGAGEFIHPVFGSIKNAQATRSTVQHDAENPDQASFSIEFIESTTAAPFFSRALPEAVSQHGAAAVVSASEAAAKLIDRLRAANPLTGLETLRAKMMGPLLYGMTVVTSVLSGLDVLAYPRAWGNDIAALVGGFLDIRDWGDQLVADWASIQSDLNAFSIFSGSSAFSAAAQVTPIDTPSADAPAQVTPANTPTEEQVIAAVAATIAVNMSVGLANAAGYVFEAESATPTLTPTEIEAIANVARSSIETTIEQVRAIYGIEDSRPITEPLKGQALAVQEAARAVIVARPPLIQRTAEAPGNFRLLAHLWYGDHARAIELYRMNGARSPFVNAGGVINAYAR